MFIMVIPSSYAISTAIHSSNPTFYQPSNPLATSRLERLRTPAHQLPPAPSPQYHQYSCLLGVLVFFVRYIHKLLILMVSSIRMILIMGIKINTSFVLQLDMSTLVEWASRLNDIRNPCQYHAFRMLTSLVSSSVGRARRLGRSHQV